MAQEIERKFLVRNSSWRDQAQGSLLRQGYISDRDGQVVRVRREGEQAWLTIKSKTTRISRGEWEYPIPVHDAEQLLNQVCLQPILEKYRYRLHINGLVWEIDEFLGLNAPLIVAEVELESEDQSFEKPEWLGQEVSHDRRYANAALISHPYSKWSE